MGGSQLTGREQMGAEGRIVRAVVFGAGHFPEAPALLFLSSDLIFRHDHVFLLAGQQKK